MANGKIFETTAKWTIKAANADGSDRQESKKGTFAFAADAASFMAWLGTLAVGEDVPAMSIEGAVAVPTLGYVYDAAFYGYDLKVKARLRPAVSAETPWISRDGVKINLATGERLGKDGKPMKSIPLAKCVNAVNNHFQEMSDLELEPKGNFVTAKRMLIESKKVAEKGGKLLLAA